MANIMDWILHRLACGSLDDASILATHPPLRVIDRVLTLSEQRGPLLPSMTYESYCPMPDEVWLPPDLWQARVEALRLFLQSGTTVLVHCRLGRSRRLQSR